MRSPSLLKEAVRAAFVYLKQNPDLLGMMVGQLAKGRWVIPLAGPQWVLDNVLRNNEVVQSLRMSARPPHLRLGTIVKAMNMLLEVSATVRFGNISLKDGNFVFELYIDDLRAASPGSGSISALLSMMDFVKPGDLLQYLPTKPEILISSEENKLVLDLALLPFFQEKPSWYRWVSAWFEICGLQSIRFGHRVVVLQWQFYPRRFAAALKHVVPAARPRLQPVDQNDYAVAAGVQR